MTRKTKGVSKKRNKAGHFSAECKYCKRYWPCGKPGKLEEHLANECPKALDIIQSYYVNIVASRGFGEESSNNSKKRKFD
ncbi:499_t:CDS:2, partial [Funneliformis geosporum]